MNSDANSISINGKDIDEYEVEIIDIENKTTTKTIKCIELTIKTSYKSYVYRLYRDERYQELEDIKMFINECLEIAKTESLEFEINEYKERRYLFVGTSGADAPRQYTGDRIM